MCKNCGQDVKRCLLPLCGKYYHEECIQKYPPTVTQNKGFRCSLHICMTCHAANPTNISASKGTGIFSRGPREALRSLFFVSCPPAVTWSISSFFCPFHSACCSIRFTQGGKGGVCAQGCCSSALLMVRLSSAPAWPDTWMPECRARPPSSRYSCMDTGVSPTYLSLCQCCSQCLLGSSGYRGSGIESSVVKL